MKFLKLIYGYVIILVRGENLERFLNLCKSRRIYMEKIRYREDGQLMAQMQAADFFRLRPLRNKTGVHIQIIQRRGMPFFFLRNKKRKAFLDEPIAGVDPAARDFILDTILNNYNEEGTVIISTHLIADIEKIMDEVIFIKEGNIVTYKSADDLREESGKSIDALFREIFHTDVYRGGDEAC